MKCTDKQTDNWIKQNGMDAKSFNATDIELLQAKKMAHSLLKDYANLLGQNEAATLNNFKAAIEDKRKEIKKKCLEPYNAFEADIKELTALIDKPMLAIDAQVFDVGFDFGVH